MGYIKNQMLANEFSREILRNRAEENFWIFLDRDLKNLGSEAKKLKVKRIYNELKNNE